MNLEDAKKSIRIIDLASQAGYKLTRAGTNEQKLICPHPNHRDTDASCSINTATNRFHCFGCGWKGDVVNWVMGVEACDFKSACVKLGITQDPIADTSLYHRHIPERKPITTYTPPPAKEQPVSEPATPEFRPIPQYLTNTYEYKDSAGRVLYKSRRYDYPNGKKEFQLCHVNALGADVFTMKGIQRVPYNYPIFQQVETIYFVEGEKCADAMMNILRMPATTTVGGSKAWQKEYAEYFKDMHMILIPDNDDAGREYMKQVAADCASKAKSIKVLDLFPADKHEKGWDIADEIVEHDNPELYALSVSEAALLTKAFVSGVRVDGSSSDEMTLRLRMRYNDWAGGGLDMKRLFPAFAGNELEPLTGGDVLTINAATGAGKTALAQNIAREYRDTPVAWFSLELEETRMHERNLILENQMTRAELKEMILSGRHVGTEGIDHIYVYDNALANEQYIDKQLTLMPLRTGVKPRVAVVDYIQLMAQPEGSKHMNMFDRLTYNATALKILAKKHNLVMIVISQIGRKEEANLGAAKGSGAIEESTTVLIGLNYAEGYQDAREIGIYKNSNGDSNFAKIVSYEGKYYKFGGTIDGPRYEEARRPVPDRSEPRGARGTDRGSRVNNDPF